jgi:hypothetical protein
MAEQKPSGSATPPPLTKDRRITEPSKKWSAEDTVTATNPKAPPTPAPPVEENK